MADRPRIVSPQRVTDTYAMALWEGLLLWVADGQTPATELRDLRHFTREYNRARGERPNVALVVIHDSGVGMDADARREVALLIDETKHTRVASATVVLAQGLVGAVHRSILTGFSLVVPPPHPVRICADVRSALTFLHPHIEAVCGPVELAHIEAMVGDLHGAVCAEKLRRG